MCEDLQYVYKFLFNSIQLPATYCGTCLRQHNLCKSLGKYPENLSQTCFILIIFLSVKKQNIFKKNVR